MGELSTGNTPPSLCRAGVGVVPTMKQEGLLKIPKFILLKKKDGKSKDVNIILKGLCPNMFLF